MFQREYDTLLTGGVTHIVTHESFINRWGDYDEISRIACNQVEFTFSDCFELQVEVSLEYMADDDAMCPLCLEIARVEIAKAEKEYEEMYADWELEQERLMEASFWEEQADYEAKALADEEAEFYASQLAEESNVDF